MTEISESPSQDGVRSRGNVLALLGGAIAGAVAGALGRPGQASAGHDGTNVLHLGELNIWDGTSTTQLHVNNENHVLELKNESTTPTGAALLAWGSTVDHSTVEVFNDGTRGIALWGRSHGPGFSGGGDGIGVRGTTGSGSGVEGGSESGVGVEGSSQSGIGGSFSTNGGDFAVHIGGSAVEFALGVDNVLVGQGAGGMLAISRGGKPAIEGDALPNEFSPGVGVQGVSGSDQTFGDGPGIGVQGISGTGVGVEAISENGLALNVAGKAAFSTAGAGTVPQGQNSVFVANSAVTADSHISVTLVGNPGNREVRWVARSPGSGFTVNVTPAPPNQRPATPFTYLIVEAAA